MLHTIAWSRIFAMCSAVITSRLPVHVTNRFAQPRASSTVPTWKPAMHAWSAQMGSASDTRTRQWFSRRLSAQPFPTSP